LGGKGVRVGKEQGDPQKGRPAPGPLQKEGEWGREGKGLGTRRAKIISITQN